jgi:hypothetical protein
MHVKIRPESIERAIALMIAETLNSQESDSCYAFPFTVTTQLNTHFFTKAL